MQFHKGEVVFYKFRLPHNGQLSEHPGVILSCSEVYNADNIYVIAMMTTHGNDDRFSFHLTKNDFERGAFKENSQIRCHLITYVLEEHLESANPYNKLKSQSFERLIAYINDNVFDI